MDNFTKIAISNGGRLYQLLIDSKHTGGTGLTNPSIYVDGTDIIANLRHVEYTLYHAEKGKFCHPWGPLQYLHKENDLRLVTNNYMCSLNPDTYKIENSSKIDMSFFDSKPLWEFVGLEDGRLVKWNNKLYISGVRRDTTTNGQGRMELSEIAMDIHGCYRELSRIRIPAPGKDDSYCEKNWMPILDMPYHYVKWCNPTEVVRVDFSSERVSCETVFLGTYIYQTHDYRGGSQVIPWKNNYRLALVHQVNLFNNLNGRKNAKYRHRFILWDKNWNVVSYGEPFDFLGAEIEFSCGMAQHKNNLLITFGFQDNSSFLLQCPIDFIEDIINV
jgi:hypothetical protein